MVEAILDHALQLAVQEGGRPTLVTSHTTLTAPLRAGRDAVRAALPEGHFVEVYVSCDVAELRNRG